MSTLEKHFLQVLLPLALTVLLAKTVVAQDPRVSQYRAIPLLVSPAQTGDFEEGRLRVLGLYARIADQKDHNNFYNASVDLRLGKREMWGIGFNYLQTGTPNIPISGKYAGLSASRLFYIDKYRFQELRLGFQASYLYGKVDESKAPYNRLIDVRVLRYFSPSEYSTGNFKDSLGYMNYSVGAKYKLTLDRLKIESGFSAYNITNPYYSLMYTNRGWLLKRYRVTALSSIYYQPDPKNALKFEHYSWKEGIYLRDYEPKRDDTTEIHETTYSLTYFRYNPKNTFNVGAYSRSWKAVYGMVGMNFNERVGVHLSYEMPLLKRYYDVSHFEVSLSLFPYGRKKRPKEEIDRKLYSQMEAILPFGTSFCLPCMAHVPASISDSSLNKVPCPPEDSLGKGPLLASNKVPAAPDTTMAVKLPDLSDTESAFFYKDTIYYDFDKYNIRYDASVTLNKILNLMESNRSLSLNIRSHTDLRGTVQYNQVLSDNRAKSAKNYLVNAGINANRIRMSWYGELDPLNKCDKCNEVLQQKNRRSELYLNGFVRSGSGKLTFGLDTVSKQELLDRITIFSALDARTGGNGPQASHCTIYLGAVVAGKTDNYSYLKDLNANVFDQNDPGGNKLYYFGLFADKTKAQGVLNSLKKLGFGNAYIKDVQK